MATDHNFKVKNGLTVEAFTVHIDGDDSYGDSYSALGFGGTSNSYSKVFAAPSSGSHLYINSGNQIYFRTNQSGSNKFTMTSGGDFQVGNTTVITATRNLTNIGTISSGSITTSGNITVPEGQIVSDGTSLIIDGDDGKEVEIRSARDIRLVIDDNNDDTTNEFHIYKHSVASGNELLTIDQSGNADFGGTISSGAITSTGRSTFDSVTIDDDGSGTPLLRVVADDDGPWALQLENSSASNSGLFQAYVNNNNNLYFRAKETGAYPTWYFQVNNGSTSIDAMYLNSSGINAAGYINGATFRVGGTEVFDSSRNLTNIGTISSGAITSTGTSSFTNIDIGGGSLTSTDNLNSLTDGFYKWSSSQPSNSPGYAYFNLFQMTDPNQKIQLAWGGSGGGRIFVRRADSGTFYSWTEFFSTYHPPTLAEVTSGGSTTTNNITVGAITANGGGTQSVIKSSSDAPLIVESTDAYSGINFKDTGGNSSMFYLGSSDHLYLNSATFSVAGSTLASGYQFQVNGSSNLTGALAIGGTTVIDSSRALDNLTGLDLSHSTTQAVNITATDSTADTTFYAARIDHNASGSDALTADRNHVGLFIDLDSTATGGDTSNEHRLYGIMADVRATGDSDLQYGVYGYSETQHSAGQTSENAGVYGYGVADDSGTGRTVANIGGKFLAYEYGTGTGGGCSHYGVYSKVLLTSAADKDTTAATGVYGEVEVDTSGTTTTLSSAYVFQAQFDNDSTDTTINNSYLFYGNYAGTLPNTAYGIYIADTVRNYFAGHITTGDGDTTNVAYGFNGDVNTGMYSPGDHQVGFAVNGSRKMYMSTTTAFFQNLTGGVQVPSLSIGSTEVIDGSRNLDNIGTISSGNHTITSSGTIGGATLANAYLTITDGSTTMGFDNNEIHTSDNLYLLAEGGNIIFRDTSNGGVILKNGSTQFMDASRNLTNIGTISSGAITSSGNIQADTFQISSDTEHTLSYKTTSSISGSAAHTSELRGRQVDLYAYDHIYLRSGTADSIFLWSGGDATLTLDSNNDATFEGSIYAPEYIYHTGDTDTYIRLTDNRIRIVAGNSTKFDSDNTYLTSLSFDGLTGKTSGTGDYSTNGDLVAGRGSGSIALTINDGKGNSNVTFNHQNGVPDQNGNAARIEVNTDSSSGATMYFEVKSNVTSGTSVDLTQIMRVNETGLYMESGKVIYGNGGVTITSDDTDFIVQDNTGSTTNFIWRDHSAGKLYLGGSDANTEFRTNTTIQAGNTLSWVGATGTFALNVYHASTNVVARFESGDGEVWIDLHDSNSGGYGALLGHTSTELFKVADSGVNVRMSLNNSGLLDTDAGYSAAGTTVIDSNGNLTNIGSIGLSNTITFGNNTTEGRYDIVVGSQTTSRGMLFAPYATFGTRYSGWDTWIGTNTRTAIGTTNSGIELATSYIAGGASALNNAFAGLNWYSWTSSELSGLTTGSSLTLGTPKFSVSQEGNGAFAGTLSATNFYVSEYIYHSGDTNTYIRMTGDDLRTVAGGRQMIRMDEGTDPDVLQFVVSTTYTDSNGNIVASGNVTAYASDRRLKTNIKPIENALDKVRAIRGVHYDWLDAVEDLGFHPGRKLDNVGVIAQEVEEVLPQVVKPAPFDQHRSADTDWKFVSKSGEDYKTVDYDKLTALLIEAVKEQQEKIEKLEELVEKLISEK